MKATARIKRKLKYMWDKAKALTPSLRNDGLVKMHSGSDGYKPSLTRWLLMRDE